MSYVRAFRLAKSKQQVIQIVDKSHPNTYIFIKKYKTEDRMSKMYSWNEEKFVEQSDFVSFDYRQRMIFKFQVEQTRKIACIICGSPKGQLGTNTRCFGLKQTIIVNFGHTWCLTGWLKFNLRITYKISFLDTNQPTVQTTPLIEPIYYWASWLVHFEAAFISFLLESQNLIIRVTLKSRAKLIFLLQLEFLFFRTSIKVIFTFINTQSSVSKYFQSPPSRQPKWSE